MTVEELIERLKEHINSDATVSIRPNWIGEPILVVEESGINKLCEPITKYTPVFPEWAAND